MLDELMDGLVLDRLPDLAFLDATLTELCRGAENLDPILHSFKNAQQLRVGVRDILGKEKIEDISGALSDIAQACLERITQEEFARLAAKLGEPMVEIDGDLRPCDLITLAMGKFGGRELNYYSDLDLVFLFESDGMTVPTRRAKRDATTTNQHFFSELGQRIIKIATQLGPFGRLYQIDPRLRPTGKSGPLAVSLGEFSRYFAEGQGQLWERQALCKARVVFAPLAAAEKARRAVDEAAFGPAWKPSDAEAVVEMRHRIEAGAPAGNLKRGPGGLVDIEFLVQVLQLKFAHEHPALRVTSTLDALTELNAAGILRADDYQYFVESYRFLRTIQVRLRLMSTTARDNLPDDPRDLAKLAILLRYGSPEGLLADCQHYTVENRRRCERLFAEVVER
jgi:glutamate-ammonia-ligase adenylyltransferase